MQHFSTLLSAFVALFTLQFLSFIPPANAQFQLYRDPHVRPHTPTTRALAAEPPSPIALRQHHEPRALLDTCAFLDANVLGLLDLKVCLCLSALPLALESNVELSGLVNLLGLQNASNLLASLV